MKFLVILHLKDSINLLPLDKRAEIQTASFAFIDKYRKSGKLKENYFTTDMQGGVALWEVASPEEVGRLTLEYPLSPFTEFDNYPLVEYDVGRKMVQEMMAAAQLARKG
jgi:hypothetical protein